MKGYILLETKFMLLGMSAIHTTIARGINNYGVQQGGFQRQTSMCKQETVTTTL